MTDKKDLEKEFTIVELMMRMSSLEDLLIKKGIVTNDEIIESLQTKVKQFEEKMAEFIKEKKEEESGLN